MAKQTVTSIVIGKDIINTSLLPSILYWLAWTWIWAIVDDHFLFPFPISVPDFRSSFPLQISVPVFRFVRFHLPMICGSNAIAIHFTFGIVFNIDSTIQDASHCQKRAPEARSLNGSRHASLHSKKSQCIYQCKLLSDHTTPIWFLRTSVCLKSWYSVRLSLRTTYTMTFSYLGYQHFAARSKACLRLSNLSLKCLSCNDCL